MNKNEEIRIKQCHNDNSLGGTCRTRSMAFLLVFVQLTKAKNGEGSTEMAYKTFCLVHFVFANEMTMAIWCDCNVFQLIQFTHENNGNW